MKRPKILYVPTRVHTKKVFAQEAFKLFMERFEVTINEGETNYTAHQIAERIKGYDGLVTGWGTCLLTEEVFEKADRLRIIAHSAGSVKVILSEEIIRRYIEPRKICVFSAREAIALNVAESTIGYLIMACRRFMDHALAFRERGVWRDLSIPWNGQFLRGSTVGLVAASKVGREVIKLLKPFDVRILVCDPYLSEEEAKKLGVTKVELNALFSKAHFVTIHAPLTPETHGMIEEGQLRLLRDGAVLVNTARGPLIDHNALLKECRTGRILVVLDVTDPEPLPPDSPFRELPNIIITPHISGAGYYGYFKTGSSTLQALEDFFAGKPVKGAISPREYAHMA